MKHLTLLFAVIFVSTQLAAQTPDTSLFRRETFTHNGFVLPYRIMYPENYNPAKRYPLIVFMHGAGERGSDNAAQLTHGAKMFVEKNRTLFPAIVIMPQCPKDMRWANFMWEKDVYVYKSHENPTQPMAALCALVKHMLAQKYVDKNRVYAGGLSMGGMGTFDIIWRMPGTFVAAFPICGAGDASKITKYAKRTSLWIFHGAKDNVVSPECSRVMYKALQDARAKVKYTEYPEAEHNSWDSAFAEKELMPWLFGIKK